MFAFTVAAPRAVVTTRRDTAPSRQQKPSRTHLPPVQRQRRHSGAARDSLHSSMHSCVAAPAVRSQVVQAVPVVLRSATPA